MTKEKKQVIIMHIDEMRIDRNNKKLVLDAMQETNPSKNCEKVIDSAYKIALLIETQALSHMLARHITMSCNYLLIAHAKYQIQKKVLKNTFFFFEKRKI